LVDVVTCFVVVELFLGASTRLVIYQVDLIALSMEKRRESSALVVMFLVRCFGPQHVLASFLRRGV
jgi:hypothetical protein